MKPTTPTNAALTLIPILIIACAGDIGEPLAPSAPSEGASSGGGGGRPAPRETGPGGAAGVAPVPEAPTGGAPAASHGECDTARAQLPAMLRLHAPAELVATFAAFAAPTKRTWEKPPEFQRVEGLPNDQTQSTVTPAYLDAVADNARGLAGVLAARAPFAADICTAEVPARCAAEVLAPLGRLLWRRPLDPAETTWLVRTLKALPAGLPSQARVEAAVRTLMLSPQALFRFEGGGAGALTDWQRADALSYALTGGPPDEALSRRADTGELRDRAVVRAELRRLVASADGKARLTEFLSDSYDVHDPEAQKKDAKVYPDFTPRLARAIKDSLLGFGAGIVSGDGPTFEALFTAASFAEAAGPRAGVFTHPAFLLAQADEVDSRPMHRARAVLERGLCMHFPDPPEAAADAKPVMDPKLSPRQRFEALTRGPECAGCHNLLNPVGFALDGYDAIGKPRTTLGGFPIDTSGRMVLDDTAIEFAGPAPLMSRLAASTTARECFVTRVFRHVAGRAESDADRCARTRSRATLDATGNVRDTVVATLEAYVEAPRRGP